MKNTYVAICLWLATALIVSAGAVLLATQPVSAFKIPTHRGVTQEALRGISKDVPGETLMFRESAIKQVIQGNVKIDHSLSFFHPYKHCDNELLARCSLHIRDLKERIIETITTRAGGAGLMVDLHVKI